MPEQINWRQRLINRVYGAPRILALWARLRAARMSGASGAQGDIPFALLAKPLAASTGALITSGGVHLRSQKPFDMENPEGDATYREIPGDVAREDLTITHKYYNHTAADQDLNVIFPLDRFRELAAKGVIGGVAPRHFGFMGHIEGAELVRLQQETAPEVAAKLREDGVDFAFLTPG